MRGGHTGRFDFIHLANTLTCICPLASSLISSSCIGTSMLNFAAFSRSFISFLVNPSALEALSLASLNRCLNPRHASRTLRL